MLRPADRFRRRFIAACVLSLGLIASVRAYVIETSAWRMGTASSPTLVAMQLELQSGGPANRTLIDGSTSWNQVAAAALADWNQYLVTMQFKPVMDSTVPASATENNNGSNTVTWSPTIYGEAWGSAIGITIRYYSISGSIYPTTETDVLFDSNFSWDSYRGNARSVTDLRRVAIHEFGHSLGLDHPDDYGQSVAAIMNRAVSNIDDLTSDDLAGGQYLYNPAPAITSQPASQAVAPGGTVTFSVGTSDNNAATYQWTFNGSNVTGATSPSYTLANVQAANQGNYRVIVTDRAGSVISNIASLTVAAGPAITTNPVGQTVSTGGNLTLTVAAGGSNLSYQWMLNGAPIVGATGSTFSIPAVGALDAGNYTVVVSNGTTASTSSAATVIVNTDARLINLSTRANVGAAALTAGFVIGGVGSKNVLVRGIGPALTGFGVTGALGDPQLTLFNNSSTIIASNAGWGGTAQLQQAFLAVGAFTLPANSADSALLATISGPNTANVSGVTGDGGNALIEVYDADPITATARLINLSVIAFSDVGANLTAGFVVKGNSSLTLLIRGNGPALSAFGLTGLLAQPILQIYQNGNPIVIASNIAWGGDAKLLAAFNRTGAFAYPSNSSADSALLVVLAPGLYSAVVSGVDDSTGTAQIEIYELR